MSLVEKQSLVHGAHTSALQRLVLGPRLEAFSLPLLTLTKQASGGRRGGERGQTLPGPDPIWLRFLVEILFYTLITLDYGLINIK
jgi:hypothetical protein